MEINIDIESRLKLRQQICEKYPDIKNPEKIIHNMAMENLLHNLNDTLNVNNSELDNITIAINTVSSHLEDIHKSMPEDCCHELVDIRDAIILYSGCRN